MAFHLAIPDDNIPGTFPYLWLINVWYIYVKSDVSVATA